jgi:hypothetical protein
MGKTEETLNRWCSGEGIQFKDANAEDNYKKRAQRIADAIQLKTPDRVPITPHLTFFGANYAGMTPEEVMYDYDKGYAAYKKTALDFQWDTASSHLVTFSGPFFEILDYKQLKWPGHGVPSNRTYQFVEDEYMKADEYGAFLDNPSDYIVRTYLPRICGALESFGMIPPLTLFIPYYIGLLCMFGAAFALGVAPALESLSKALAEFSKFAISTAQFNQEMQGLGFPILFGGLSQAPFDTIGDSLRGTRGIMLDMFRQPENLQKAMDRILNDAIQMGMYTSMASPAPTVFIPLHKGPMGFMSLEQFKTFYWPTLQKLILALIDQGRIPMLLIEADYTDRLEIISDIPPGKVIYWFEQTDIFKAKEILGDRVCIRGNVPSSLLCTGTPDGVRDYCKKLIDIVGKGGGLIIDGDIGIPDEAKVENVRAMTDFVMEYGVYA